MAYFIEATQKLIAEEGINGISIRKIAAEAGYNSATLYNYFDDFEHLVLFASVRYLRKYVAGLQEVLRPSYNALEIYRIIYRQFSRACFEAPEIFYNMFFGRHSNHMDEVLRQYYELFPDELGGHTGFVRNMLSKGNIYHRDMEYMDALIAEGFVAPEKREMTVQVLVRTHQSFIYEAWVREGALDIEAHIGDFMKLFDHIMNAAV